MEDPRENLEVTESTRNEPQPKCLDERISQKGAYLILGRSHTITEVFSSTTSHPQPLQSFINEWSTNTQSPPLSFELKHNWIVIHLGFSATGPPSWVSTKEGIKTLETHPLHVTFHCHEQPPSTMHQFCDQVKRSCDQTCVRSQIEGITIQTRYVKQVC